jgi:hypothetical protein
VRRFYAYNHSGHHPERLVGWFDRHMGAGERTADERSAALGVCRRGELSVLSAGNATEIRRLFRWRVGGGQRCEPDC